MFFYCFTENYFIYVHIISFFLLSKWHKKTLCCDFNSLCVIIVLLFFHNLRVEMKREQQFFFINSPYSPPYTIKVPENGNIFLVVRSQTSHTDNSRWNLFISVSLLYLLSLLPLYLKQNFPETTAFEEITA